MGGIGYSAPSDLINIAGIGVGGRGASNIRQISDPDVNCTQPQKITYEDIIPAPAQTNTNPRQQEYQLSWPTSMHYAMWMKKEQVITYKGYPKAKIYKDFRKMLEKEKSIDAVVIGTPDHTHTVACMMAIKMGKHVYCEKPLTHTRI